MKLTVGSGKALAGKAGYWTAALIGGFFVLLSPVWLAADAGAIGWFGFCAFVGVGGLAAAQGIRGLMALAAFEVAELQASDSTPLGGVAVVVLQLSPKRPLTINGAKLTVYCEEWARYDAGTRSRTYVERLWNDVLIVEMPKVLQGPYQVELKVKIPTSIPPTFSGSNNKLRTVAHFELDIDNWPDLELDRELIIRPEVL